jgi:hypothetical protein
LSIDPPAPEACRDNVITSLLEATQRLPVEAVRTSNLGAHL